MPVQAGKKSAVGSFRNSLKDVDSERRWFEERLRPE
jgi:hypothetical protein